MVDPRGTDWLWKVESSMAEPSVVEPSVAESYGSIGSDCWDAPMAEFMGCVKGV